jgi:hypothetical protein
MCKVYTAFCVQFEDMACESTDANFILAPYDAAAGQVIHDIMESTKYV